MNDSLKKFSKNVFSQNGEDGIIGEILNRLSIKNGQVCEFGAWDGKHLSNTFNLIQSGEWKGFYIEGDKSRFNDLLKTSESYNITPICRFVDVGGENSLDSILSSTDIKTDFEILSIDIDSFDYQIWESLEKFQPKIVIIEVNSGIIPPKKQVHGSSNQGSSFQSTLELGIKKGYSLICHTGNMIFVRDDLNGCFENINSITLFDKRFVSCP